MSRSLGLREDQREGEKLVALIAGLFPLEPYWPIREQARSHKSCAIIVGAGLLAKRSVQPIQN